MSEEHVQPQEHGTEIVVAVKLPHVDAFFGPTHRVPVPSHFSDMEAKTKPVPIEAGHAEAAAVSVQLLARGFSEVPPDDKLSIVRHELQSIGPRRVRDVRVCLSMGHPVAMGPDILLLGYDEKGWFRGLDSKGPTRVGAGEIIEFEGTMLVPVVTLKATELTEPAKA